MPAVKQPEEIRIAEIKMATRHVTLVGTTGLFINRMSAKAKRQLMVGSRKKTASQRLEIKHDPYAEFRDSMLVEEGNHEHSAIWFPAMGVKSAMGTAALHVDGVRKTDVNRLVFLPADNIPIFGIPALRMDIMRSADMARTPDVRTRAFFSQWATQLEIRYSTPTLSLQSILSLLHNAGIIAGIGDSRQEKGKGGFGTFRIADDASEIEHLLDLPAQLAAIDNPMPANRETEELLEEYAIEVDARAA